MKKIFVSLFSFITISFFSQNLTSSLSACYALDGTGAEPINNLTGTLSAITPTVDRFNNPNSAMYFNGTVSSYISLPNNPLLKPTSVSFSGWVKLNALNSQIIVFAHNGCTNYHEGYQLALASVGPGNSRFQIAKANNSCSPGGQAYFNGATPILTSTWYHVGFYIGADSLKLYVNGVLDGTMANPNPIVYNPVTNVYLGGTNLSFNLPFSGTLDNARFYNRKLTGTEFNLLYTTDPACVTSVSNPNCNTSFYAQSGTTIYESGITIPNTSTLISIPPAAGGFAVGPSFGFPAPNPTFWTILASGTYAYYNGTSFINTGHSNSNGGAVNIGGSKNFIYSLVGGTGQVYKYNGTGAATLVATIPALANGGPYDLVGDDQDNFYFLRTQTPQSLNVYDPTGVLTCSYSLTGILPAGAGGGFAIVGNTVTAHTGTAYYVGTISGSVVNFTSTPSSFSTPSDFANCYLVTTFSSNITANPSVSLTCTNPTITLTASSTLSPLSYTWSGPGIVSPINNASVQVNVAGVYTCSITATNECPVKTSVATFTVLNGGSVITPTISSTGSLSCTNPTTQLSVSPNSATNTILWNGPGIIGSNNTPTISVNVAGIYSVTLTNLLCSGTTTINILSGISPLTLNPIPSNTQICLPSASATLSVTGATNYTWAPAASLIPSTGSVVIASPGVTTTYTINGTTGVCSGSAIVTVSVNTTPTITASGNSPICAGTSATLSAVGATSYTWNPGNLIGTPVVVSPESTTVYTVTGSSGLCTDSKTISITVNNSPTLTVVSSPTVLCSAGGNSATLTANGAVSYTWNPGAVVSSSTVITPTITSTYSVTGTNALGCASTTTVSFSVTPTPTLITSSSSTSICAGSSVTLNAVGASSYTWNPGALTGGTITVNPASNTIYTVTGSNGNCTSTATIAIVVNANPTITASSSPTLICSGSSSTLSANGALTYTWNPGALTGQTINVTPATTTNYTVSGTSASGCVASAVTSVSVNITPTLIPIATPTAICIGGSSTLSVSGATSYTWNPGNLTGSNITVSPIINTTYTVLGSSANCFDTKTVTLIVNPLPVVNATSNPTAICVGNSATLTGSGASTYSWMPGNIVGTSVSVSPIVNTTYTVTGTNGNGCVNTKTVSVLVNANPTITAISNPTSICSASSTSATLTAGGAITYTWVPGNLIGTNVTVTPTTTTVYTVTGTNSSGCTSTKTVSILVSPTPTLTIIATPTAICRGGSATLTASGATNYTWLPGGSTNTSIIVTPTVNTIYTLLGNSGNCSSSKTFTLLVRPRPNINILAIPPAICKGASSTLLANGANSYTWNPGSLTGNTVVVSPTVTTIYTVTGANAFGCTNTATTNLLVNPTPTISTTPSSTLLCSGASATLTSNGALTYVYNPGAQTGSVVVVTPTVTTTYSVTGVNNFGCTDTKTISIAVGSNPTITAASSASLACNGTSVSLSASGATNYTWMPGSLTGNSVVTTVTNSANTYTVIGENGGCFGVTTLSVLIIDCNNSFFGITKAAGKPVLVNNSFYDVTFTITAVNASSLNLTNVSLNEDLNAAFPFPSAYSIVNQPVITSQNSSLTVNPLFDGSSQISLTAPGSSTLLANKRDTVVFTVRIDPKGYFGPFKNSVIGFADVLNSITLSDSSNNGFSWDPDGDGDPTNNDTITIINLPLIDLFIPEGFTPDGDGKNDVFFIKGLNGRPVKLTIFNRWGNKVYEKSDYDNSWNGYVNTSAITLGSNKVPAATYYYIIEFLDGNKESRTGFVVVQY